MEELKLKPCPFCGKKPEMIATSCGNYVILCDNHDWKNEDECKDDDVAGYVSLCSWGKSREAKDALIKAWNTRAGSTCVVGSSTPQSSPHGAKVADHD